MAYIKILYIAAILHLEDSDQDCCPTPLMCSHNLINNGSSMYVDNINITKK